MNIRSIIALGALCVATTNCTDADAPPPRIGMKIVPSSGSPAGCGIPSSGVVLPEGNAPVGRLDALTPQAELDAMELLRDGADGADVSCTFKELAPGSHEISAAIGHRGYTFSFSGTTGGAAYVVLEGPVTGSSTYESEACTFTTHQVKEGGGEGVVAFDCPVFESRLLPDNGCAVEGAFYVKSCRK